MAYDTGTCSQLFSGPQDSCMAFRKATTSSHSSHRIVAVLDKSADGLNGFTSCAASGSDEL